MTKAEELVMKALKRRGFNVLHRGWPDFLAYSDDWERYGPSFRGATAFAVEVKANGDKLSDEQRTMHRLFGALKIPVYVVKPKEIEHVAELKGRALLTRDEAIGLEHRLGQEIENLHEYLARLDALRVEIQSAMQLFTEVPS